MTRLAGWSLALAVVLWLLGTPAGQAQQPTVQVELGSSATTIGEPVQFQVQITGGNRAEEVPRIEVDGLETQYMGVNRSTAVEMGTNGFRQTAVTTHIFQITPLRAGSFTIPALEVHAGPKSIFTEPVVLKVDKAGSVPAGGVDGAGFAEIAPEKTSAYVGEAVPVELRLYIDQKLRFGLEQLPTLEGEAFTKAKFSQASQSGAERAGRRYDVITVRTVVTPTKAGKLPLGPLEYRYNVQIPRATRQNPGFGRSPFDSLFNDPFGAFGRTEPKRSLSETVLMDVKPLPTAGRPASFTGAVGDFRLTGEGTPTRVKVGDPLTMRMEVRGMGTFDRVGEPVLAEPSGWRAYPATSSFKAEDEFGNKGAKSFEVAVIPEAKQTTMPVFEFSFLDPATGKYQTLRTKATPLVVEGDLPPPPQASNPAAGPAQEAVAPQPLPAPKPTDIVGIRYDLGPAVSLQPLYAQRGFLLAQLVPLAGLVGLLGVRFWPKPRESAPTAAWRRERQALLACWRKEEESSRFFATGARLLRVDAALRTGQSPESFDRPGLTRLYQPDEKAQGALVEVFERHAHALYAGVGGDGGSEDLPREERHRIINALSPLLKRS